MCKNTTNYYHEEKGNNLFNITFKESVDTMSANQMLHNNYVLLLCIILCVGKFSFNGSGLLILFIGNKNVSSLTGVANEILENKPKSFLTIA